MLSGMHLDVAASPLGMQREMTDNSEMDTDAEGPRIEEDSDTEKFYNIERYSGPMTCGCYYLERKRVNTDRWRPIQTHVISVMDPNDGASFVEALLTLLEFRQMHHHRQEPPSEYRIWKNPFYVSEGPDGMGFEELRDHTIGLLSLFSDTQKIFGVWVDTGVTAISIPLIEGRGITSKALREEIAASLLIDVRDVVIHPHFSTDMVSASTFAFARIRLPNKKTTPQEHDVPKQ